MKKKLLLFAALMMCITACSKAGNNGAEAPKIGDDAMGRYMETEYELPNPQESTTKLKKLENGNIYLVKQSSGIYISKDDGVTWEKKDAPWFEEAATGYLNERRMAISSKGEFFLAYEPMEEETEATGDAAIEEAMGESGVSYEDMEFQFIYLYIDENGTKHELDVDMDSKSLIGSVTFLDDGRLLAVDTENQIFEIDMETGKKTQIITPGDTEVEMVECGDNLYVVCENDFYIYDKNTMEQKEDEVLREFVNSKYGSKWLVGGDTMMFSAGADGATYIACADGLYRHVQEGSIMEQVIDGKLVALGDPTYSMTGLCVLPNDEFLIGYTSEMLVRYTFDETVPTVPEQELKVYSLRENALLRKAAAAYQKENPNVFVNYEYGLTGEDGKTEEDAIKAFHTELMSGNGADVILLDGMPMDSYINKGILLDIKEAIQKAYPTGSLLDNIVYTYEQEGKLFAVPMQFRVPIIAGPKQYVESMESLSTIADNMEALKKEQPEGFLTGLYLPEQMLNTFAMTASPSWMTEDGTLDEAAIKEFLTQTKRIWNAELSNVSEGELEKMGQTGTLYSSMDKNYYMRAGDSAVRWFGGDRKFVTGYVGSISLDLDCITSVMRSKQDMAMKLLNTQSEGVFLPDTIAGVSASAKQPELAMNFVISMLSEKVMGNWNGFPVNKKVFDEEWINPNGEEKYGNMAFADEDSGKIKTLDICWPNESEKTTFLSMVNQLQRASVTDNMVKNTVVQAGIGVLEDSSTVDEAVAEIMKKVQIYLSE